MKKGIFDYKDVSEKEIKRMQSFSYPFTVSKEIIGNNFIGKTIVDIGSGPNTELGIWINKNGGEYIAFDKQEQFLKCQRVSGLETLLGDIISYRFGEKYCNIMHIRFVLMHIPSEKHDEIIRKILLASKDRALFLEFDWHTFKSGGPVTSNFGNLMLDFFKWCGADPFIGDNLAQRIHDVYSEFESKYYSCFKRFRREKDLYYHEIIPILEAVIGGMEKMQYSKLGNARELLITLEEEAEKENPEKCVPPDIVAVTVFRESL